VDGFRPYLVKGYSSSPRSHNLVLIQIVCDVSANRGISLASPSFSYKNLGLCREPSKARFALGKYKQIQPKNESISTRIKFISPRNARGVRKYGTLAKSTAKDWTTHGRPEGCGQGCVHPKPNTQLDSLARGPTHGFRTSLPPWRMAWLKPARPKPHFSRATQRWPRSRERTRHSRFSE
jgi:hypothetical protein